MTPKEFKETMKSISEQRSEYCGIDQEVNHIDADNLMCKLLEELGYSEGVVIFKEMPKWYA